MYITQVVLFCYSHNPALFETIIQAADGCGWQEHLVGLPVHKLIGTEREKTSAATTHSPSKVLDLWSLEEVNYLVRVALEGQTKVNPMGH